MGLRNRTQQPFWRVTPIRSTDPSALYQHGIECVGKRDGKGMVATGWALCQVTGLHQYQAGDFLTDGYRLWRESPGFDRGQGAAFLADLFGALCSLTPPTVPADIWSASSEAVMPASIYYGTRCWAGNELLEVATDQETKAQYEPLVFRSATEAPHDFVPTRSIEFAKAYAARNGLPEPWVIVLPGQREVVPAGAASGGRGAGTAPSELTNYAAPPSGPAPLTNYAPPEIGPAALTNYTAPASGPQQLSDYAPPQPPGPLQDDSFGVPAAPPAGGGDGDREQRERAERERAEREQRERAEQEARERAERERIERERAEREAWERAERQRVEREERERQEREAREQAERERVEREAREQAERERQERERLQREAWERAERERLQREAWERAERERQEREARERAEQERLEQERQEQARMRAEREAWERAERQRAEREQAEREQAEQEARQRAERERQEQERARAEYERQERERQERETRERAERERMEQERQQQERDRQARESAQAPTERPRPRPRPTPGPQQGTPRPTPSPTVISPIAAPNGNQSQPSWPAPQGPAPHAPAPHAPAAQAPSAPPATPSWQQQSQPDTAGAWAGQQQGAELDASQQTVEFIRPVAPHRPEQQRSAPQAATPQPAAQQPAPQQPAQQPAAPQASAPAEHHENASTVPPRLADLRSKVMSWLGGSYRDVRLESNGWITIPDIGPSVIQIETSIVQGGHLKAEVFAPLVLDVPLTTELFRYVGLEGGRFHFGFISLDAGEDGTDEQALLQFSHSLLADNLQRDDLLAVVWLVAATIVARAPELQRRFGGVLYAEIGR